MPMAGDGIRFKKKGFKISKPLIKIKNIEMFLKASKTFGHNNNWLFLIKINEFKKNYIKIIKNRIQKYKIIFLKKKTKGQADTIFKAQKYIDRLSEIYITSCDLFFRYKKKELNEKLKSNDLIVFVSKPKKNQLKKVNDFGWLKINNHKIVKSNCKKKVSNNPENDWIIIGSFVFKNKIVFNKILKELFKLNVRVNNEFYLDSCVNVALKLGLNVSFIKVTNYISWGTPVELINSQN